MGISGEFCGKSLNVETGWRMTQSGTNCSLASNSLIIRENTGNFRDFDPLEAELQPKKSRPLSGFCRNSLLDGTGNYFDGTGKFFEVTGNSIRRTGYALIQHPDRILTQWIYSSWHAEFDYE